MSTQTSQRLQGKTALVTASSRGIGRAIALRLASDGAEVAVTYQSNAAAAQEVVDTIVAAGGKAVAFKADFAAKEEIENLYKEVLNSFGKLDIVVNNAGIAGNGPIADLDDETFDRVVDVNFKGTFYSLRQAAAKVGDGGRIVNISTGYTHASYAGVGAYAATKAAVEALGLALAKEVGGRGITVNSVLPGLIETDQTAPIKDQFPAFAAMMPLGRIGQPEDVADIVAFLASDDARYVTGQYLAAAGGLV
ncbi:3-oxoacyl-ACP reductase family protein [Streptomyces sp. AP-93]|uniref:3-oxoacyl-ACP reductase family protein n=1 Tax=Streptomyces sp. AP-93 TaxID=2929048 RepID=UPI001FAED9C6|nr:3-oxoacyl-ACP reductase family protein [Streptomyces sp. AP-93]MCJ0871908.1 3-oxoacyl-ACP reductase FabG [Streptomyces sp. AP-93]